MVAKKISDIDLIRAILHLQEDDSITSARCIAAYLKMAPSTVHRRLHVLHDKNMLGMDERGFFVRARAIDAVSPRRLTLQFGMVEGVMKVIIL